MLASPVSGYDRLALLGSAHLLGGPRRRSRVLRGSLIEVAHCMEAVDIRPGMRRNVYSAAGGLDELEFISGVLVGGGGKCCIHARQRSPSCRTCLASMTFSNRGDRPGPNTWPLGAREH